MHLSSVIFFSHILCFAISFFAFAQTEYTKSVSDVKSHTTNTNILKSTKLDFRAQLTWHNSGHKELGDKNETMGEATDNKRHETEEQETTEKPKCTDTYPYCYRYVKIYGLDPPFTLCDKDWFIRDGGKYGCKKSCNLCYLE